MNIMPSSIFIVLGEIIKSARKKRGFSQVELAEIVGVTQPSLSKIEKGDAEPMRKTLIALAKALGTNFGETWLDEHLNGNDAPKSKKEIGREMTASELVSYKFPGGMSRHSTEKAAMLAKLLDAEVERIKREGW